VATYAWAKEREELEGLSEAIASRIALLGIPIDRVSLQEALDLIARWIEQKRTTHLVLTPDTTALMRARWDEPLREIYQGADLVTADGVGLVWASRLLGAPLGERVAGIDLMEALCERAARRGYKLFLLGAKPGIAQRAACNLKERLPDLAIVGAHHGYFAFGSAEEEAVLEEINRLAPDILLVGMGVPRQELWMRMHRDSLSVPVMMGVGGSFDVLSGCVPRAPLSWQRLGLEWLWRTIREPSRLRKVRVIPLFMLKILLYKALQPFG